MLAAYHRWVFENHRVECVEVLREWVIQEAEFHSRALETVQGLTTPNYRESQRTFFTGSQSRSEPTNDCQGRGHRSCIDSCLSLNQKYNKYCTSAHKLFIS